MQRYNFSIIEKKWQDNWDNKKKFRAITDSKKKNVRRVGVVPIPSRGAVLLSPLLEYQRAKTISLEDHRNQPRGPSRIESNGSNSTNVK